MVAASNQAKHEKAIEFSRSSWLSHEAGSLLAEAVKDRSIGPDRTLSIILHHGLGLSVGVVAALQNTTKAVVHRRLLTGTKRLAAVPTWEMPEDITAKTLADWLSHYLDHCEDLKASTRYLYASVAKRLVTMFQGRALQDFTPEDAEAFALSLASEGLANRTIASMVSAARSMFRGAVRAGLLLDNPFRIGRERYVTRAEISSNTSI